MEAQQQEPRSILDMTASDARAFLLKPESYCSLELPSYIDFGPVLAATVENLPTDRPASVQSCPPRECAGVNHTLYANKDGRHAWRPFQIIHPALYVRLVRDLTKDDYWWLIKNKFIDFSSAQGIECLSIPGESQTQHSDQAAQVTRWWHGIEQRSIELSLEYQFVFHADIADCYGSIYTHAIAWALHTREEARENRNDTNLLGNRIDRHIQDMREGQTNGIPQGSVVMDLIAEVVLGYADVKLAERLKEQRERLNRQRETEFHILRYRDDYRIFVNNPEHGERVLRALTEVLMELGLKLNSAKTSSAQPVIRASLKADKWAWLLHKPRERNLQKHLLAIHAHGEKHPNAGSLVRAMSGFYRRLSRAKNIQHPQALIGITLDIGCHSPRVFPQCAAVMSRLLSEFDTDEDRHNVLAKILTRLHTLTNIGFMEVWLQRISYPIDYSAEYEERMCKIVRQNSMSLWNSEWISCSDLSRALKTDIIDRQALSKLEPVVASEEIDLFSPGYP